MVCFDNFDNAFLNDYKKETFKSKRYNIYFLYRLVINQCSCNLNIYHSILHEILLNVDCFKF